MILAQLRRQMMVTEITGSCDPSNNLIRIPGGKGSEITGSVLVIILQGNIFVELRTNLNNRPGVERIITGSNGDMWYTPDYYENFIKIR